MYFAIPVIGASASAITLCLAMHLIAAGAITLQRAPVERTPAALSSTVAKVDSSTASVSAATQYAISALPKSTLNFEPFDSANKRIAPFVILVSSTHQDGSHSSRAP